MSGFTPLANVGELPCICVGCDDVCMAPPAHIGQCVECAGAPADSMFCHRRDAIVWCKLRALAYIDAGDVRGAFTSFASDVTKDPRTAAHSQVIAMIGMPQLITGQLDSPDAMRRWIEGFA